MLDGKRRYISEAPLDGPWFLNELGLELERNFAEAQRAKEEPKKGIKKD